MPQWFGKKESGGGLLFDMIHAVDLLRNWTRSEVSHVYVPLIDKIDKNATAEQMGLAAKTYVLEKEWHSTKSTYDKYAKYLDSEPVSYRRCSELLKDLENTGLVVSKTGSKGQKGYSSEFQLVMDPGIVGEIIDKEWWEKVVVNPKKKLDELKSMSVTRNNPYYGVYQQIKKEAGEEW